MMNDKVSFFSDNVKRYRKVIDGGIPDYAPFRCWMDDYFCCEVAGVSHDGFGADLEKTLHVQKVVNERFYDVLDFAVGVDTLDVWFDIEQFRLDHPATPSSRILEHSLYDFDKYYSRRNVKDSPCVQKLNEAIAFFNKNLPNHKHVCHYSGVWGCMDMFSVLRGTAEFFTDLYDDPKQVHRIFSWITERSLEWLGYVHETWGDLNSESILFDKLDIGEDYCAYLPPDLFDKFVVPYTGKLFEEYKGRVLCSLHTDGDIHVENLSKLRQLGIEEFMGFSPRLDIKEVRKALPDTILAGNVDPISVMTNGTPDDVKAAVRYCFENAGQDGRFVVCTGGGIGAGCKPENVDALLESVYEICRY